MLGHRNSSSHSIRVAGFAIPRSIVRCAVGAICGGLLLSAAANCATASEELPEADTSIPDRAPAAAAPISLITQSEPAGADTSAEDAVVRDRRATAIALNYCRAAFHRIRRYPAKHILLEEKQKILNNLDLNGIADAEVVALYTSVLDEIEQVEFTEREQEYIRKSYRSNFEKRMAADLFTVSAQVATGQLVGAIRSGANSWWDTRTSSASRDSALWKLDRTELSAVKSRSAQFMNSLWTLSKRKQIPDEWLVRDSDLDRLEFAINQADLERRLRMLSRMERFMECYPPFYYYVARTQQQLGLLQAAETTYQKLTKLGGGHFRKDEMLAAGSANLALIQKHFGKTDAALASAEDALQWSNHVWQANLSAAWVLGQSHRYDEAEDAILTNLDVQLEQHRSSLALVSLYYHSGNEQKLARVLSSPAVVARVPIPGLLLCASRLGEDRLPGVARRHLSQSMYVVADKRFGRDGLTLVMSPAWKMAKAEVVVQYGEQKIRNPQLVNGGSRTEVRFARIAAAGGGYPPRTRATTVAIALKYPGSPPIRVHLGPSDKAAVASESGRSRSGVFGSLARALKGTPPKTFRLTGVQVGTKRLSLREDMRRL